MHNPGIQGKFECFKIHISEHQDIPGAVFNDDCRNQAESIFFHALPAEKCRTDFADRHTFCRKKFLQIHDADFTEVKKAGCENRVSTSHSDCLLYTSDA